MKSSHRGAGSSKASFNEQRLELNPLAIEDLYKFHIRGFYSDEACVKDTFNGYYLFALSESEVNVPATAETIEEYGDIWVGGRIECRLRLRIIADLRNHMIADAGCYPYLYADRNGSAFIQIASIPDDIGTDHPYITVLDRGYDTVPLLARLMTAGLKFVARLNEDGFFKDTLQAMAVDDGYVEMNPARFNPAFVLPDDEPFMDRVYTVRVVRVRDKCQTVLLATNLAQDGFPKDAFDYLYSLRWGDKAAFRYVNDRLKFKWPSGTRNMIIGQDIFATVHISNLAEEFAREYAADNGLDLWYNDRVQSRTINRSLDMESLRNKLIYALLGDSEDNVKAMTAIYDEITSKIGKISSDGLD